MFPPSDPIRYPLLQHSGVQQLSGMFYHSENDSFWDRKKLLSNWFWLAQSTWKQTLPALRQRCCYRKASLWSDRRHICNRFLTNVLRNLTSALSRLTQASEAQTAALADLKEDLLLQDDTPDEEQNIDKQPDSGYITTVVNNCTLDLSKKNVVSDGRSDSEAQSPNDIVESRPRVINLTRKNPQRSRVKLQSSSTDTLLTGGLSADTAKESAEKYTPISSSWASRV